MYHGFGWFEPRERRDRGAGVMEGVPQVSIVDTPHPHDDVTYLTTVAVCRGGEEGGDERGEGRRDEGMSMCNLIT